MGQSQSVPPAEKPAGFFSAPHSIPGLTHRGYEATAIRWRDSAATSSRCCDAALVAEEALNCM